MQTFTLNPVFATGDLSRWYPLDKVFSVGQNRSWVQGWMEWVLPWTLIKDKPGVTTIVIDLFSPALVHSGVSLIKYLARSPGLNWKVLATLMAVAVQLGIPPEWIEEAMATPDPAKQKTWLEKINAEIEARTGGRAVLQFRQGQFVDP